MHVAAIAVNYTIQVLKGHHWCTLDTTDWKILKHTRISQLANLAMSGLALKDGTSTKKIMGTVLKLA